MSYEIFSSLENAIVSQFGSLTILALGIILFFLIAFLLLGIDFRFVLLFISILIIGLSRSLWIPSWVEGAFWILIVGFGIYQAWNYLER